MSLNPQIVKAEMKASFKAVFSVAIYRINSYSASHDNWCTGTLWNRVMTAQCEGMGEVGSARYEPALLPPCPSIRVLSYSNCQRSTQSHQQSKGLEHTYEVSSHICLDLLSDIGIQTWASRWVVRSVSHQVEYWITWSNEEQNEVYEWCWSTTESCME